MKRAFLLSVATAVTFLTVSAFASTGATNCKVTALQALEGDNDQYATVECESGTINVLAKSESVKAILLSAKLSDKKINISVRADYAFQKPETLHKIGRVELN